jgi:hypothetical protein
MSYHLSFGLYTVVQQSKGSSFGNMLDPVQVHTTISLTDLFNTMLALGMIFDGSRTSSLLRLAVQFCLA